MRELIRCNIISFLLHPLIYKRGRNNKQGTERPEYFIDGINRKRTPVCRAKRILRRIHFWKHFTKNHNHECNGNDLDDKAGCLVVAENKQLTDDDRREYNDCNVYKVNGD